jgi:membrane-associated protease RseP (regulator of RpoE activity)
MNVNALLFQTGYLTIKKIEEHAASVGAKVALLKLIPLEKEGYGHVVWYFAKSTIKGRLGLMSKSLDLNDREKYKRNTGAIVSVVMDRSPAFYANLIPGDIVVEINNTQVDGSEQVRQGAEQITHCCKDG